MQVARVKAVNHFARSEYQRCLLAAYTPIPDETPLVHRGSHWRGICLWCILMNLLRRSIILLARVSDIGLWRHDIVEISRSLRTGSSHLYQTAGFQTGISLPQQLLYYFLGLRIFSFAKVVVANRSLSVDKIVRGPILILKGFPDG